MLLTAVAMAASACAGGTSTSPSASPGPTGPTQPTSDDPAAGTMPSGTGEIPAGASGSLTVELDPDGPDGPEAARTRTLACAGDGSPAQVSGDEPFDWGGPLADAEAACAALEDSAVLDALAPPPADQICTEIFGGPSVAHLTGELLIGGDAISTIDRTVTRANGCEIAAWDTLAPLLGPPPPFTD